MSRFVCNNYLTPFISVEDEYLTTKQLSAVRFHRNHRLMGEIFSEYVIPDIRYPLSSVRLDTLKEQSKSLEEPLKRLEEEVAMLETKYINKRAKFLDDAEKFRRELRKVTIQKTFAFGYINTYNYVPYSG